MLAKDFGRAEEAERILAGLRLAVALQRRMQFRPESAMYFRRPGRCLGGVGRTYGNAKIRIDYVQHNISALLGYQRVLRAAGLAPSGGNQ